jgi:hypothetical protein
MLVIKNVDALVTGVTFFGRSVRRSGHDRGASRRQLQDVPAFPALPPLLAAAQHHRRPRDLRGHGLLLRHQHNLVSISRFVLQKKLCQLKIFF